MGFFMAIQRIQSHWRDSGRTPRFFFIDARSSFPLLLFLVHIKWWTFFVAVGAMLLFGIIEHFGFTTIVFLRMVRSFLAGKRKLAKPWWRDEGML